MFTAIEKLLVLYRTSLIFKDKENFLERPGSF